MDFLPALIIFILIILASGVKIAREWERVFVFQLGRLILPPKGPGIFLIIPIVDRMRKISLRSEKDLEEAERLLEEAKTQKDANLLEIDRHLRELAEVNYPAAELRGIKNQNPTVLGADNLIYRRITSDSSLFAKSPSIPTCDTWEPKPYDT